MFKILHTNSIEHWIKQATKLLLYFYIKAFFFWDKVHKINLQEDGFSSIWRACGAELPRNAERGPWGASSVTHPVSYGCPRAPDKAQKTKWRVSPPQGHPRWPPGSCGKGLPECIPNTAFISSVFKHTVASFELCWKWYWLLPLVKINFSKFLKLCFLDYQKLLANYVWILPITKNLPRALGMLLFFNLLLCWNQHYSFWSISKFRSSHCPVEEARSRLQKHACQRAHNRGLDTGTWGGGRRQGPMRSACAADAATLRRIFKEAE